MGMIRREVELSARMQAIADLVTPGGVVCDVGCDHGFLSVYLVQQKISPRVIAMDVRSGPLSRCAEHVEQYGLEHYITMRLSDGLEKLLPGEADTVVCAGMGGRLMQRILTQGRDKVTGLKELILQPQSELKTFREFLRDQGYGIVKENMIEEEGKFYPMMKVIPPGTDYFEEVNPVFDSTQQSLYDRFGKTLLAEAHPVLYRFLKDRERMLLQIKESIPPASLAGAAARLEEIDSELADISRAFEYYRYS